MKKYRVTIFIIAILMACVYVQGRIVRANGFKVCIDAGHQEKPDKKLEAIGPGDTFSKPRVSSGTRGVGTKKWEYEVTLESAQILKELLVDNYEVIMTREKNDINISNRERALIANDAKADINIRIHCDSIKDGNKTGASILIPSKNGKYTKEIYEESNKYALELLKCFKESGVEVNGIFERADLTGFNYSKVPTVVLEMGFMSNYNEDKLLATEQYQRKLMILAKKSIDSYKNIKKV